MKELTIEEKAKAYDKAIEKAKLMIDDLRKGEDILAVSDLESMFPELKESEDERIRRNIIAALKGEGYYDCDLTNECIAWVEKQGEQKSIWHNEDEEPQRGSLILLIMQGGTPIVAKIIEPNHSFNHGERWAYIDDLLEKQGEQKPADKHEPKFQNEQWIVWQNKCYKVNYNGCGYELIDQNGLSTSLEYETVDKSAHLWTINDAKPGDVLSGRTIIFIFKDLLSDGSMMSYCDYVADSGESDDFCPSLTNLMCSKINPATKEQRDTLLKAMTDAGYTFDFESKELKKIEQKSQRMVSAEAKEALYDKPTDEEMKELLRTEYEKGIADTIAEMKSSWSEEDEKVIAIINNALTESNTPPDDYDKVYDWLESLRKRIGG